MSLSTSLVIGSPACCCALAVGPFFTGLYWPVISFSFSVILRMVSVSRRPLCCSFDDPVVDDEVEDGVFDALLPDKIDCAILVGPPLTGPSFPVILRSPIVMSCTTAEVSSSPTCDCAAAVGPPLVGSSLLVKVFSAAVICEIKFESTLTARTREVANARAP